MSIFNQKSKFKVKTEIKTVRQAVEPKPKPSPNPAPAGAKPKPKNAASLSATPRASPNPATSSTEHNSRKRRAGPSRSSSTTAASPFGDSDDSGSDDDWQALDARKRRKQAHALTDLNRVLRHKRLWTGSDEPEATKLPIIHAADVASLKDKCQPVLKLKKDEVLVRCQYPGARYPEKYELVSGKDKIDAVKDIMKVVNFVASTYLTEDRAKAFLDPNTGIYRRLEKSRNTDDGAGFKAALKSHNQSLISLQRDGTIAKNLDGMHGISRELVSFILDQVYDRTVAPNVELLSKYENGTDNVYGELLHPFISDILERTKATSDKVFVDLGSGVGNVVIQAALEIGCESWGCEMMENACNLADKQHKEFIARCRLWGIAPGKVHLERGDFRKNEKILAALKRADVVLVNNQAFTSQLNDNLVNMFLDLKPGCKVVSLKTFVHDNKIAENDVATSILDVEHLTYPEEYVSWTSASGTYCISTRKG